MSSTNPKPDSNLELDKNGNPVLRSGVKSAPFSPVPDGVDTQEWHRRMDAVRAAARELDPHAIGDASEFIQGSTQRDLTPEELDQFTQDVTNQRLNNLVDWLDHNTRKSNVLKLQRRRVVRVIPPRGWITKTIAGLTNEEVKQVIDRLVARG